MNQFKIPVWINILSLVGSVFLVYLLAKWDASKQQRSSRKEAELKAAETSLRSKEKDPAASMPDHEKPVLKKAA